MILVTGSTGMVGNYLVPALRNNGFEVIVPSRQGFDLTRPASLVDELKKHKFNFLVHLAAETNVDLCEKKPSHAYTVNALATQKIADYCSSVSARMIYISTSNVFGATPQYSYNELDLPNPVNYYGKSKLLGEVLVRQSLKEHFIVRAGWMIGGGPKLDKKFVGKILNMLQTGSAELTAVSDKFGSLTYAKHLAEFICGMIESNEFGTYHFSSRTVCSRYDVAKRLVSRFGKNVKLDPCSSSMFPLPAPRPSSEALETVHAYPEAWSKTWEQLLDEYLSEWRD